MDEEIKRVFERFPKLERVWVNEDAKKISITRKSGFKILLKKDFKPEKTKKVAKQVKIETNE